MIVHIFENIPHHYHNFIQFYANHGSGGAFPPINQHKVYIQASGDTAKDSENSQQLNKTGVSQVTLYSSHKELLTLLSREKAGSQFIFHSLLSRWLWLSLLFSSVTARSHWVSWGADLYQHVLNPVQGQQKTNEKSTFKQKAIVKQKDRLKQKLAKWIQSIASRRMMSVKCLNPGDAALLTSVLGRKTVDVLPYPLVGVGLPDWLSPFGGESVSLLLGNSAAPSNNHFELIDAVAGLADSRVMAYMPLNYAGSEEHTAKVISYGKQQLGSAFHPITEMLTKDQYDKLLASVDGAVFAHDRQQGLYVAYYMMLHGKKLFLKASTSTYDNFVHYGFAVESLEQLANQSYQSLSTFNDEIRLANQSILNHSFTEQALGPKWGDFFQQITVSSRSGNRA